MSDFDSLSLVDLMERIILDVMRILDHHSKACFELHLNENSGGNLQDHKQVRGAVLPFFKRKRE